MKFLYADWNFLMNTQKYIYVFTTGTVLHTFNLSTQEAEVGHSLRVWG